VRAWSKPQEVTQTLFCTLKNDAACLGRLFSHRIPWKAFHTIGEEGIPNVEHHCRPNAVEQSSQVGGMCRTQCHSGGGQIALQAGQCGCVLHRNSSVLVLHLLFMTSRYERAAVTHFWLQPWAFTSCVGIHYCPCNDEVGIFSRRVPVPHCRPDTVEQYEATWVDHHRWVECAAYSVIARVGKKHYKQDSVAVCCTEFLPWLSCVCFVLRALGRWWCSVSLWESCADPFLATALGIHRTPLCRATLQYEVHFAGGFHGSYSRLVL